MDKPNRREREDRDEGTQPDFKAEDPGKAFSERRGYTAEIGSEGGSTGDVQTADETPDLEGSEAEGIARRPRKRTLHDREAGQ